MRKTLILTALIFSVVSACVLADQSPAKNPGNLTDYLAKQNHPMMIKLQDLTGDWVKFRSAGDTSALGDAPRFIYGLLGVSSGKYYTKGDAFTWGDLTYLVAYAPKAKQIDPTIFMKQGPPSPPSEKLSPDTSLYLCLLNLKTFGSLIELQPFDLKEETVEAAKPEAPKDQPNPVVTIGEDPISASTSNLKQLGLALMMYTQDWDGKLPPLDNPEKVKTLLTPYVSTKDSNLFTNPIDGKPYKINTILSNHTMNHITSPASMVIFYEDAPASNGTRGVCFLDGHVKRVSESEWPRLKLASKIP